jgi:hypothetical protein
MAGLQFATRYKGGGFVGAYATWKSSKVATFVELNPQMFKLLWI